MSVNTNINSSYQAMPTPIVPQQNPGAATAAAPVSAAAAVISVMPSATSINYNFTRSLSTETSLKFGYGTDQLTFSPMLVDQSEQPLSLLGSAKSMKVAFKKIPVPGFDNRQTTGQALISQIGRDYAINGLDNVIGTGHVVSLPIPLDATGKKAELSFKLKVVCQAPDLKRQRVHFFMYNTKNDTGCGGYSASPTGDFSSLTLYNGEHETQKQWQIKVVDGEGTASTPTIKKSDEFGCIILVSNLFLSQAEKEELVAKQYRIDLFEKAKKQRLAEEQAYERMQIQFRATAAAIPPQNPPVLPVSLKPLVEPPKPTVVTQVPVVSDAVRYKLLEKQSALLQLSAHTQPSVTALSGGATPTPAQQHQHEVLRAQHQQQQAQLLTQYQLQFQNQQRALQQYQQLQSHQLSAPAAASSQTLQAQGHTQSFTGVPPGTQALQLSAGGGGQQLSAQSNIALAQSRSAQLSVQSMSGGQTLSSLGTPKGATFPHGMLGGAPTRMVTAPMGATFTAARLNPPPPLPILSNFLSATTPTFAAVKEAESGAGSAIKDKGEVIESIATTMTSAYFLRIKFVAVKAGFNLTMGDVAEPTNGILTQLQNLVKAGEAEMLSYNPDSATATAASGTTAAAAASASLPLLSATGL